MCLYVRTAVKAFPAFYGYTSVDFEFLLFPHSTSVCLFVCFEMLHK